MSAIDSCVQHSFNLQFESMSQQREHRQFGRNITNLPGRPIPIDYLSSQDKPPMCEDQLLSRQALLPEMRKVIAEWLCQVHQKFRLSQETLYIAIGLMDRMLCAAEISELQLLGSTSLWLASKYEEIYPPHLKYFAEVSDGAFSRKEVLRMEQTIFRTLEFKVTFPTRHQMLLAQLQSRCIPVSRVTHLADYLLQLSLLQPWNERQQDIARGALYLASRILKDSSIYPEADIKTKTIGYRLSKLIGNGASISCKYDTEEHCFVGGIFLDKKKNM